MARNWLTTGASSGLGRAIAAAALERGDRVALVSRSAVDDLPGDARSFPFDVRDTGSAPRLVADVLAWCGHVDVLVNAAGRALVGAVLLDVLDGERLPLRLVLGSDALALVEDKQQRGADETAAWRGTAVRTDYPT